MQELQLANSKLYLMHKQYDLQKMCLSVWSRQVGRQIYLCLDQSSCHDQQQKKTGTVECTLNYGHSVGNWAQTRTTRGFKSIGSFIFHFSHSYCLRYPQDKEFQIEKQSVTTCRRAIARRNHKNQVIDSSSININFYLLAQPPK